ILVTVSGMKGELHTEEPIKQVLRISFIGRQRAPKASVYVFRELWQTLVGVEKIANRDAQELLRRRAVTSEINASRSRPGSSPRPQPAAPNSESPPRSTPDRPTDDRCRRAAGPPRRNRRRSGSPRAAAIR